MSHTPATTLTEREREIAELVAIGFTNKRIAERASLSVSRIEDLISAIAEKWALDRSMNLRVQITKRILSSAA